jgi:hypothetical protein
MVMRLKAQQGQEALCGWDKLLEFRMKRHGSELEPCASAFQVQKIWGNKRSLHLLGVRPHFQHLLQLLLQVRLMTDLMPLTLEAPRPPLATLIELGYPAAVALAQLREIVAALIATDHRNYSSLTCYYRWSS